jgi:hypothetical protein
MYDKPEPKQENKKSESSQRQSQLMSNGQAKTTVGDKPEPKRGNEKHGKGEQSAHLGLGENKGKSQVRGNRDFGKQAIVDNPIRQEPPTRSDSKYDDDQPPLMIPPAENRTANQPLPTDHREQSLQSPRDNTLWSQSHSSRLDLNTGMGNTYLRQVFEPYLAHLQRISALDRVNRDYQLYQARSPKRIIPVGGRRNDLRYYFVGRIRIFLTHKHWTPIPSVSPKARILWYRTEPRVNLSFARDGVNLMYVRSRRKDTQMVYLQFGTDGESNYFGGTIPNNIRPDDYPMFVRPIVPMPVRQTALKHLRELGIVEGQSLKQILNAIVPFLRAFVPRELHKREHKSNPFSTLWTARVGVCRHRAMLFMIAIQSLGYPARLVSNQAHAFAEVAYPDGRWRQIDLGGGDIPNWMGRWRGQAFTPPKDPFPAHKHTAIPWPPSYTPPPSHNPLRKKAMPSSPSPNASSDNRTDPSAPQHGSTQTAQTKDLARPNAKTPQKPLSHKQTKPKRIRAYVPHTRL